MPNMNIPDDAQETTLRRWRVMEVEARDGTRSRHVWGHDVKNGLGCASSVITKFNLDTMTATTLSGRNYKLVGLPGNSRLGKNAWIHWCSNNKIVSEMDVTNEYLNIDQLSTVQVVKFNSTIAQEGSL